MGHLDERDAGGRSWSTGRAEAISELFRAHHRRLVGLASLLVDDRLTSEDIVQEAFAGFLGQGRAEGAHDQSHFATDLGRM